MNEGASANRGMTIIELAVTLAVFAILVALIAPGLSTWTQNSRVRTTSDLIQSGLRRAQSEAVQQNRVVAFILTNTLPTPAALPAPVAANTQANYWYAATVPWTNAALVTSDPNAVTTASNTLNLLANGVLGADAAQVLIQTATPTLCFSPYGRLTATSNDPTNTANTVTCGAIANVTYDVTPANSNAGSHPLRVTVSTGGQIRLCDPSRSLTNYPDGC